MQSKLLIVTANKQVQHLPHTEEGITAAVEALTKSPAGAGNIYRLDYYVDKHGDTMPRSTKIVTIENGIAKVWHA